MVTSPNRQDSISGTHKLAQFLTSSMATQARSGLLLCLIMGLISFRDPMMKPFEFGTTRLALFCITFFTRFLSGQSRFRDGTRVVSGSHDNSVHIWDTKSGAILYRLEGHSLAVVALAISDNGLCIVSGSDGYTVRIWDARMGIALH